MPKNRMENYVTAVFSLAGVFNSSLAIQMCTGAELGLIGA